MAAASGFLLTLAETPGGARFPLARRVEVESRPGTGRLDLEVGRADAAWSEAAEVAWAAARRLAGAPPCDGVVRVRGAAALAGGSAGHPLALLLLAALLDVRLPPHFAVGHLHPEGFVVGGRAAAEKARAASDVAEGLGFSAPVAFLYPPVDPPLVSGSRLAPRRVLDVAGSLRALDAEAAARVAGVHARGARAAAADLARVEAPYVEVDGEVAVVEAGRVLHRGPRPADPERHAALVRRVAAGEP